MKKMMKPLLSLLLAVAFVVPTSASATTNQNASDITTNAVIPSGSILNTVIGKGEWATSQSFTVTEYQQVYIDFYNVNPAQYPKVTYYLYDSNNNFIRDIYSNDNGWGRLANFYMNPGTYYFKVTSDYKSPTTVQILVS